MAQVTFNGKQYAADLVGRQPASASIFAPIIQTGAEPSSKPAEAGKSTFVRRNLRGGLGIYKVRTGTAIDRYSWGGVNTDFYEKAILPTKATSLPEVDDSTCELLRIWNGALYGVFDNSGTATLRRYLPLSSGWTDALATLDGKHTGYNSAHYKNQLVINYGEKMVLVDTSGVATLQAHEAVDENDANIATEIRFIVNWQGELYGINDQNLLVIYNANNNVWDNLSVPALPTNESVNAFLVASNASGVHVPYIITTAGVYVWDITGGKWDRTSINLPGGPDHGAQALEWRGSLYFTSDSILYAYTASISAILGVAGPSKDDGLPFDQEVRTRGLAGDTNRLYLPITLLPTSTNGFVGNVTGSRAAGGAQGHRTPAINIDSIQKAYILQGTEGDAWNAIYTGDDYSNDDFTAYEVGTVSGQYGIYFAQGSAIRFLPLASGIFNPNRTPDRSYVADRWKKLEHSIYNSEDISIDKSMTDLFVECDVPIGTELCVSVILDETPSTERVIAHWHPGATDKDLIPPFNGIKRVQLPFPSMPEGIKFDSFQIIVQMRTDDESVTPSLRGVETSFRRILPPGEQFNVSFPIVDQNQNINLDAELRDAYKKVKKVKLQIAKEVFWVYLTHYNSLGAPDAGTKKTTSIQATFTEG